MLIDGVKKGVTPLGLTNLPSGLFTLQIKKDGYEPFVDKVRARKDKALELTILLEKQAGTIVINCNRPGAKWYLDGGYMGTTPDQIRQLTKGSYLVEVKQEGYATFEQQVTIIDNKEVVVKANLASAGPKGARFVEEHSQIAFVWVSGGCFQMGISSEDDALPHEVCLDGFYIAEAEVNQEQYVTLTGRNPSFFAKNIKAPVEQVSYEQALEFAAMLSGKAALKVNLPTEAQWEYAAKAGQDYIFAGHDNHQFVAWVDGNSKRQTQVGKLKQANGHGIYDMSGNVWEWCLDWYGEKYYGQAEQKNPAGPKSGTDRVIRGGSYDYEARYAKVSSRYYYSPDATERFIGFRLVIEP